MQKAFRLFTLFVSMLVVSFTTAATDKLYVPGNFVDYAATAAPFEVAWSPEVVLVTATSVTFETEKFHTSYNNEHFIGARNLWPQSSPQFYQGFVLLPQSTENRMSEGHSLALSIKARNSPS